MSMRQITAVSQQGRRTTRIDKVLAAGLERGFRGGATISTPYECEEALEETKDKYRDIVNVTRYVDLLRNGGPLTPNVYAFRLSELADRTDDANRNVIVKMGGIQLFVALVRDGTGLEKESAARALWKIAGNNSSIRTLVGDLGGIPPLVTLLGEGNNKQKENAARALQNIAHNNDSNKMAITAVGGIPLLVALVRNGTGGGSQAAKNLLVNLAAGNNVNSAAIRDAGGGQYW